MVGLFVSFESAESKQDQCTNQELGLQSHCKGHVQNKDTLDWMDSTDMKYLKEDMGCSNATYAWLGLAAR